MQENKELSDLKAQVKELRNIIDTRRVAAQVAADSMPRKTAAAEAHTHILAGRNIGVVGIGGVVLTIMVALINNVAASITAFVVVGILGYMTFMRVKAAQYLEQKYGLTPKPIFKQPEQKQGGFSV
jgi:hypothetical protein